MSGEYLRLSPTSELDLQQSLNETILAHGDISDVGQAQSLTSPHPEIISDPPTTTNDQPPLLTARTPKKFGLKLDHTKWKEDQPQIRKVMDDGEIVWLVPRKKIILNAYFNYQAGLSWEKIQDLQITIKAYIEKQEEIKTSCLGKQKSARTL
jgi:hypothetical protein